MTIDVNSAVGQGENANAQTAIFFSDLNKALADTTGSLAPPNFGTFISTFDYSEILRAAASRASNSASYQTGAFVENVHGIVAMQREFSMCGKTKINYYEDAVADSLNESNFYATMKVLWSQMMLGNYVNGSN